MTTTPDSPVDREPLAEPEPADQPDTREKFRAALERKRQQQASRSTSGPAGASSQATHGAAGARRVFRRKSG